MRKQQELEDEIKQVEKLCPKEVTDGGKWNRLDVLKAELKGRKEALADELKFLISLRAIRHYWSSYLSDVIENKIKQLQALKTTRPEEKGK